jgi:hypothetical protein
LFTFLGIQKLSDLTLWGDQYSEIITYLVHTDSLKIIPKKLTTSLQSVYSIATLPSQDTILSSQLIPISNKINSFSLRMIDPVSISVVDEKAEEEVIDSLGKLI